MQKYKHCQHVLLLVNRCYYHVNPDDRHGEGLKVLDDPGDQLLTFGNVPSVRGFSFEPFVPPTVASTLHLRAALSSATWVGSQHARQHFLLIGDIDGRPPPLELLGCSYPVHGLVPPCYVG